MYCFSKLMITIAVLVWTYFLPNANAVQTPRLPFPQGEVWQLQQGYWNPNHPDESPTHYDYGSLWADDRYALDFAYPAGIGSSWGRILVSPVSGIAEVRAMASGYGNTILIDEEDGHKTRVAHNSKNVVASGQRVVQGQPIALCGNTGFSISSGSGPHAGSHVHIARYYNGVGVSLDGLSDYSSFAVNTNYTSDNQLIEYGSVGDWPDGWHDDGSSYAILQCYLRNGGYPFLGVPVSNNNGGVYVHPWYSQNGSVSVLLQDLQGTGGNRYSLVHNPDLNQAFL